MLKGKGTLSIISLFSCQQWRYTKGVDVFKYHPHLVIMNLIELYDDDILQYVHMVCNEDWS